MCRSRGQRAVCWKNRRLGFYPRREFRSTPSKAHEELRPTEGLRLSRAQIGLRVISHPRPFLVSGEETRGYALRPKNSAFFAVNSDHFAGRSSSAKIAD